MTVFVDDVAAQAVEACLLAHTTEVLSPTSILEMPADLVTAIAEEPEDCQVEREQLTRKLAVLKSGLEICKRYASRPIRGTIPKVAAHGKGVGKAPSPELIPEAGLDGPADLSAKGSSNREVLNGHDLLSSADTGGVAEGGGENLDLGFSYDWNVHVGSAFRKGKSGRNKKR